MSVRHVSLLEDGAQAGREPPRAGLAPFARRPARLGGAGRRLIGDYRPRAML
ncbi:hypothetical protein BSLA_03f1474 [Burkholderia stabilis]|nr:hypothetical protein BSLA_03f1474 [Burkholderia stabilis]